MFVRTHVRSTPATKTSGDRKVATIAVPLSLYLHCLAVRMLWSYVERRNEGDVMSERDLGHQVVDVVSAQMNVPVSMIMSERTWPALRARTVACLAMRDQQMTTAGIARVLGRDRSTIISACQAAYPEDIVQSKQVSWTLAHSTRGCVGQGVVDDDVADVCHQPAMSWRERTACRAVDTAVFFDHTDKGVESAKAICAGCEVRDECLDERLSMLDPNDLDYGVWGGMTPAERAREAYERRNLRG